MSRIVLIGANHAGTAAANTILDNYPGQELTIFDKNDNISYLGCGTALWVGRQIDNPEQLFYCSRDILQGKGATVHMETAVERIDFDARRVHARRAGGEEVAVDYDQLILATGSLPIVPRIPGKDLDNVKQVKLFQDGQAIDDILARDDVRRVAVVGAGYIGVEIVEAVKRRGKEALLFEAEATSLAAYYDPWFTQDMDRHLRDNGIELHFAEMVQAIEGEDGRAARLVTDKGAYPVDMVILSIGFRPNTALGDGRIAQFGNGAFLVDRHQATSLPGVYAIGDCATVYSNALRADAYIALATNAVRSGVVAGHNVCGTPLESAGVQGSNGISIFGYNMVSTGLTMRAAERAGFDAAYTEYEDLQKPAFITENNHRVKLRIVYDKTDRRVLGAQMASFHDISLGIHLFSLAVEEGVTIDKLKLMDIFFLPHFNQPYNYITMAALAAK